MLRLAFGIALVLAAVGLACFVMTTNRLPFTSRTIRTHCCPRCERRFDSIGSVLVHEITDHHHP